MLNALLGAGLIDVLMPSMHHGSPSLLFALSLVASDGLRI
jgi:hypothetical protein